MTKTYVRPDISLCGLDLEGFLCASGDPLCLIYPIDAEVASYVDGGSFTCEGSHDVDLQL